MVEKINNVSILCLKASQHCWHLCLLACCYLLSRLCWPIGACYHHRDVWLMQMFHSCNRFGSRDVVNEMIRCTIVLSMVARTSYYQIPRLSGPPKAWSWHTWLLNSCQIHKNIFHWLRLAPRWPVCSHLEPIHYPHWHLPNLLISGSQIWTWGRLIIDRAPVCVLTLSHTSAGNLDHFKSKPLNNTTFLKPQGAAHEN